jgi:hypothetical protein
MLASRTKLSQEVGMSDVEVFAEGNENSPLFIGRFSFLPRVGDTISQEMGGYFSYYDVLEVWHRQDGTDGTFRACVGVRLID